jgi:hypothetical protein
MASEYAAKQKGLDPTFEKYINMYEEKHPPYNPADFEKVLKVGQKPVAPPPAAPPTGPLTTSPPKGKLPPNLHIGP